VDCSALEARIANFCHRKFCFLVGHANTGISLALKVIERLRGYGDVILPTVVCPSVAQTVRYAGFTPVFADVTIPNCTIDPDSMASLVGSKTRAIVPVHIFGHAVQMNPILEAAEQCGSFVIEDAAQSIGGITGGWNHGSYGSFSVLSFGTTKILSAGAGGALLTDDAEFAGMIREWIRDLPPLLIDTRYRLRALSHRNLCHGLVDLLRLDQNYSVGPSFQAVMPLYREQYFHAFPDDPVILRKLDEELASLRDNVSSRVARARRYRDLLSRLGDSVQLSNAWEDSGVIWRYTLLVREPAKLLEVTAQLRNNLIHASNHYWSVADLMYDQKSLRNSAYVSPRLLNLWVDEAADDEYIERTFQVIHKALA